MIEVQGLRHCFGRREVLRDLTFSLEKGGFAFLTGPSGAGKSTLLRILHGSLPLQEGRAVAAGHDLAALRPSKLHQLRRDVAMVFQDFKILPERSVADNVALPLLLLGRPDAARVQQLLERVGLGGLAARMPAQLSGGQLQRVALARALVHSPALILADEPTGNLDPANALRMLDLLAEQVRLEGAACLLATHAEAATQRADRVIRLTSCGIVTVPAGA